MPRLAALLVITGTALLGGCGPEAPPVETGRPAAVSGDVAWPYWPVSMRVHPVTRVSRDPESGELVIEARVEFTDADGVTARSAGEMHIVLLASPDGPQEPLDEWQIDLADRAVNAQHFDVVTRTYLFKLRISAGPAARGHLSVGFDGIDGRRLSAEFGLGGENAES